MTDLYVGLMSGTSLDGVDAVVADFSHPMPSVLGTANLPFPTALRSELLSLNQGGGESELARAAEAEVALSRLYAEVTALALQASSLESKSIAAIGCHGQTVRHQPERGYTVQLVNGAWLAELTGITVVTDFRSRDIAAGGQGAPLVPAFHDALFRHEAIPRVILNLGGIANITVLIPGKPARGFDCGPGNLLMDGWAERHLKVAFDAEGRWAQSGKSSESLLSQLLTHPHFHREPPKSTGRDEFHLTWLERHDSVATLAPQDVQATLLELTTRSIADCIEQELAESKGRTPRMEVFCCGGGARNNAILERLAALLPEAKVLTTAALGVPVDQVEALAFAWLARELIAGRPGNLPAVTGAGKPVPLGAIYPA